MSGRLSLPVHLQAHRAASLEPRNPPSSETIRAGMKEAQEVGSEERPQRAREQPAPNDRGEEWVEEFNKQVADRKLYRRALAFARGSVSMLQSGGVQVASAFAEDLLASAIADTWRGVLSWTPGPESSLLDHITAAIRSRARDEGKRARRYPSASLDAHEEDEDGDRTSLWTEAENALAANAPATDVTEKIFAIEAFDRARALAGGDHEVVKMLDEIRSGATDRADLMRAMGMSARRYESVRRRLDRLLLELPASMRRGVPAVCSCRSTRPQATRHMVPPCSAPRRGGVVASPTVRRRARGLALRTFPIARRARATEHAVSAVRSEKINSKAIPRAPFPG